MRVKVKEIIREYQELGSVSRVSGRLGIHRSTVYRWIKRARLTSKSRFGTLSTRGLKRRKPGPKNPKRKLTVPQEFAIITLREQEGYTAQKIQYKLKLSASISTIHRLLKRKRLLNKYGNHRRPYYQKTTHMHLKNTTTIGKLQMDVKYMTPELTGLPYTCFEYAVIDIYSRYKEAVILNHLDQDGAILALIEIRKRLPFTPDFIQTDNGFEFQGRFHEYCKDSGLNHHLIHKSTPNENAVIERSFRTDEEEFFFRMKRAPFDYGELRIWFAEYIRDYNYQRPHLGINLKTPSEVVALIMKD
jgi:transposase InsO family protein